MSDLQRAISSDVNKDFSPRTRTRTRTWANVVTSVWTFQAFKLMQKTWEKWNVMCTCNVCLEAGFAENDFVNATKKILRTRIQPRTFPQGPGQGQQLWQYQNQRLPWRDWRQSFQVTCPRTSSSRDLIVVVRSLTMTDDVISQLSGICLRWISDRTPAKSDRRPAAVRRRQASGNNKDKHVTDDCSAANERFRALYMALVIHPRKCTPAFSVSATYKSRVTYTAPLHWRATLCITRPMPSCGVCPSVCPSVAFVYFIETSNVSSNLFTF